MTNMHHHPPEEGNFCDERKNALKPATIQDYNRYVECTDKSDHMMNTYSISRWSWKLTKKNFSPTGLDTL
jgi:hypothetical protein